MKIFLARHADAIEYTTNTVKDDNLRYLTSEGRVKEKNVAEFLREYLKDVDLIFSSPLIRAVQTAEIIASEINYNDEIILLNELKSETPLHSIIEFIKIQNELSSMILVSHEPKLSILTNSLAGKTVRNSFSKSAICCINYDRHSDNYNYEWYFDPKKMEFVN